MLRNRFLEAATTRHLIFSVSSILLLTVGVFALLLGSRITDLDKLSKFVDAVFKAMAILLGMIWTLNRYYIGRADTIRLRVDSDVSSVRYSKADSTNADLALLIFRLDVVNIGAVLIPAYQQSLEIESVTPSDKGIEYGSLYRWPDSGKHPAPSIEPASWAAINDAISIPGNTKAVRVFLEIKLPDMTWTWHKTFDISEGMANEKQEAR
jgi:hypothetical protein